MISSSRLFWVVLAVFALRMAVGFHFFMEGTAKLKGPEKFDAAPFFRAARGPLAPTFYSLLDDPDHRQLFCIHNDPTTGKPTLDPSLTFQIWNDFADRAYEHYRFNDDALINELQERIRQGEQRLASTAPPSDDVVTRDREALKAWKEATVKVRSQLSRLESIVKSYQEELQSWLEEHRTELLAHFSTRERIAGFERDGAARSQIIEQVDSLRQQTDSIVKDRYRKVQQWTNEVTAIWDALERDIQGLAVDRQATIESLAIHRPFQQSSSKLSWINQIIPWFDLSVGLFILIGLFTRWAALAGAMFLLSVIATQPPWVSGAKPVYYESVEMFALFFLAAVGAGRLGGLDYFFGHKVQRSSKPDDASGQRTLF